MESDSCPCVLNSAWRKWGQTGGVKSFHPTSRSRSPKQTLLLFVCEHRRLISSLTESVSTLQTTGWLKSVCVSAVLGTCLILRLHFGARCPAVTQTPTTGRYRRNSLWLKALWEKKETRWISQLLTYKTGWFRTNFSYILTLITFWLIVQLYSKSLSFLGRKELNNFWVPQEVDYIY